ncbi:GMC family oxidoreductase N-terminal domain-containing protein [Kaistia dalseonensis]|uniref:Choline dehydrogenase n=1 Tax=Kaistia dalseonensis TaxID=410840 RepID=A0ABU0H9M5_9HYPH|nr:GMC family oxidoreductase N-terminal domain-containing protein [Kaistia dalseonensis]MCX5496402.1 GMC family oxidoreductase N-terminal domain-containing protein [Kaistia dalseonensis]MDQ0439023.1 choline dehydrogenase [Kaistia dalseonensis]
MAYARSAADLKPAYDYVVIGGGSGGAVVARRLSEAGGATVLLIEAGPSDRGVASIADPTQWVSLTRGPYDWGYDYAPTAHVNGRTIGIPRGKVLGGSSAINAMMWYRGHPRDYDAWDAAGAKGWSFRDCLPYFKRCEDWEDGETEFRGAGGPLRIERSRDPHPVARAMIDGAVELGMPRIDDPNGATNEGATLSNFNIASGTRWSAARGCLWPVENRANLTILTQSLAIGLGFEGSRCVSVRHLVDGVPVETRADGEVILALGAIDTPRLMMLSGIGDPEELKRLDIATHLALPGVGRNLQDHPLVRAVNFRAKVPMGAPRDNGGGSMLNWKSRADLPAPDLHAFCIQSRSAVPEIANTHDLSGDVFALAPGLMGSKSIGYLRLHEASPMGRIEIQPNYLVEQADLDALVTGVDFVMDLAGTAAFADLFAGHAAPTRRLNRAETVDFIRNACSTFFHTCGTAKMGADAEAVVDAELKVHGMDGLRVADASVIPIIPSCNTHAPVTMIAERAADFILGAG